MEEIIAEPGCTDDGKSNYHFHLKRPVEVYPQDLHNTLSECWRDELFTDLVIKCRNDKGWTSIPANLSVLVAASPFMKRIISETSHLLAEHCLVMDNFSYKEVIYFKNMCC